MKKLACMLVVLIDVTMFGVIPTEHVSGDSLSVGDWVTMSKSGRVEVYSSEYGDHDRDISAYVYWDTLGTVEELGSNRTKVKWIYGAVWDKNKGTYTTENISGWIKKGELYTSKCTKPVFVPGGAEDSVGYSGERFVHVHQCYNTSGNSWTGRNACAPTSTVMIAAYFKARV